MKYMLDTNICIYAIKHKPPEVIKNFLKHDPDDMCISSITYGELMHGVEKSQAVERNRVAITLFLSSISILQFDNYAAEEYGKVLVTNNTREFFRVDDLEVEDWTKE